MGLKTNSLVHAGEIVVDALIREGVQKVFCTPGSHIIPIYDGLRQAPDIQLITCKQEPNASLMADAYGRITGRPGVCLLTAGPGGANSVAGIAQAYGAASPVVHITGSVPLDADKEAFHGVDDPEFLVKMYRYVTKWSTRVERIDEISDTMAKAFQIAQSGRPGPVHVEIPRLSDLSPYLLQSDPVPLTEYRPGEIHVAPVDNTYVQQIAEQLLAAKCPVLCAGKGIIRRKATDELVQLSRKFSIPVIYPQDSMGVIPSDNSFALDHYFGNYHSPLIREILPDCDLLLSIGLRADTAEIRDMENFAPDNHILVGFDDAENNQSSDFRRSVMDPKLFLDALLKHLGSREKPGKFQLENRISALKSKQRQLLDIQAELEKDAKPIHPGFLMKRIANCLNPDSIVISDVGNCQMFARYYIPLHNPLSFMQSGVWNAMSFSLPTAIVAKLEFPERDVVGLVGDGAFLMTMGDFITACELNTNIVQIVLNDGAYGQMIPQQMNQYGSTYGVEFLSPNFAAFGEACGAVGIRIEDPGDIEAAVNSALKNNSPTIIEVMTREYPLPKCEF